MTVYHAHTDPDLLTRLNTTVALLRTLRSPQTRVSAAPP